MQLVLARQLTPFLPDPYQVIQMQSRFPEVPLVEDDQLPRIRRTFSAFASFLLEVPRMGVKPESGNS